MKTSDMGLAFIASHEGIVPAPYKDSVGVWTYGIGHTAAAGYPSPAEMVKGMPPDLDKELEFVLELFAADIEVYESAVNAAVRVPVEQHEFDALVSFHFNTGAIRKAKLTEFLNAGDIASAGVAFMGWSKPKEIIPRRKAERQLFMAGDYGACAATVWGAKASGAVTWSPERVLGKAKLIDLLSRGKTPAPNDMRGPIDYEAPTAKKPHSFWGKLFSGILSLWRRK